jgi:hypothetical protein
MAPSLSGIDGLRLLWHVARPLQLGGFVAPSRRFWPGLVRRRVPDATYQFLNYIRKKYGPRVRCWFPFDSTILVLDGKGIDEVLRSESNAADPRVKRWALRRFTPFGLLVSRGDEWHVPGDRRRRSRAAASAGSKGAGVERLQHAWREDFAADDLRARDVPPGLRLASLQAGRLE